MAEGRGGAKALLMGLIGGIIGCAAVVAALYFTGVVKLGTASSTTSATTESSQSESSSITISASDEDETTANVVAAKVLPSVVSITATLSSGSSVGSGAVLDTNGNIVTNYHVIDGATAISLSINGEGSYEAEVVGYDESSDLAVIKIDTTGLTLTPIEIGDSSKLEIGDWVMSIGSPFGLEQSVSTGIVSSLYRSTMLTSTSGNTIYTNLIQTDAAVNPGNSGGPLVNNQGQMVGINSIITSYSGSSSGVGFAIPSNYVKEVTDKIIAGETVTHAYLGGNFQTVNASNAARNNLSVSSGAYVSSIVAGSPAEEAGLEVGDIITAIDGDAITSSGGVVLAIRSHEIGDKVSVTFVRGTEEKTVEVTLGSDEELQKAQSTSNDSSGDQSGDDMSTLLEDLFNRYYGGGSGSGSGNSYGYGYGYGGSGNSGSSS